MVGVFILNKTRTRVPGSRLAFSKVAHAMLPDWEISLVFVGRTRARLLNTRLRGKSYVPNVLSYTLHHKSGEIIICPNEASRQASAHGMNEKTFILYLFIHGLLHIKGWRHGAKMEKCEHDLLARFAKG